MEEKARSEKTKKFKIELLMYNNIFVKGNKANEENNLFVDKDIIILDIPIKVQNNKKCFQISELIKNLRKKGYPLIKYSKLYIHFNYINDYILIDDKNANIIISTVSLNDNLIKLKVENDIDSRLIEAFPFSGKINKKNNKRKSLIKNIIERLYVQRRLNNGYYDDDGNKKSYSLDKASNMVDCKKKTMDDHMTQIRNADNNGFNFNENLNEDITFLRKSAKKKKREKKIEIKEKEDESKESNLSESIILNEDEEHY